MVAYHLCLNLPAKFSQPANLFLAKICYIIYYDTLSLSFKSNGRETPRLSISKASDVKKHLDSHRDSQPKVATISNGGGGHGHSHGINMGPDSSTSIRDFLAVLALSFHAVFEVLTGARVKSRHYRVKHQIGSKFRAWLGWPHTCCP